MPAMNGRSFDFAACVLIQVLHKGTFAQHGKRHQVRQKSRNSFNAADSFFLRL